ncbi:MAG: serine/threonine protein kinase [Gammaproteobacteria bacterium]|nr:serine/threonine protein kinase [Gammaproteobacteria bacterium]
MAKLGNMLFNRTQNEESQGSGSAAQEVKPADVSKLYKKLHEPKGSPGDVIELLEEQKRFLRPEEIINHSLRLDSEYAIMLLQLVDGSEIPVDLSKLSFQLDKIDSAEYRIKLLHYFGSINEPKIPLIVARFLDDSNKVVILEALKTLDRVQIDFDASVLLPYAETMTGIEFEQVMAIIEKQADADLVPHLSAYLTTKNEELNDLFAEMIATKVDRSNFQKFLQRLTIEDESVQKGAIACLQKFPNENLTKVAHQLSGHKDEFVRESAKSLVVNLIGDDNLGKIGEFALNDNAQVRGRAIQSLSKSANRGAISILQKLVDGWPEDTVLVLRAVKQLGFGHGLEVAFDALESPEPNVQRAALETIEAIVDKDHADDVRDNLIANLTKLTEELRDYATDLVTQITRKFKLADLQIEAEKSIAMVMDDAASTTSSNRISPLDKLKPGDVWMDRYHIKKEIGRGAMGRVMLVEDDMVDEALIIKFMLPALTVDKKSTERFKREVKYARKVSHRNVIRVHDLLINDGVCAISMEYFESGGLEMILKESKAFEVRDGLKLLYQAASGMAAAHEQEVIHRDLKPSNILIDGEGLLKIVDFGIASAGTSSESTLTQTGSIIGSPAYLAPERAVGADADERCDIYSLGVIAYYVLSGKLPYVGKPMEVIAQHREGGAKTVAEINPATSAEVSALVEHMMAVDPEARIPSMVAVRDSIRKLIG